MTDPKKRNGRIAMASNDAIKIGNGMEVYVEKEEWDATAAQRVLEIKSSVDSRVMDATSAMAVLIEDDSDVTFSSTTPGADEDAVVGIQELMADAYEDEDDLGTVCEKHYEGGSQDGGSQQTLSTGDNTPLSVDGQNGVPVLGEITTALSTHASPDDEKNSAGTHTGTAALDDEAPPAAIGLLPELTDDAVKEYTITDIDDRLPYRQGWPRLPVPPVRTSYANVPKALSSHGPQQPAFSALLAAHKLTVHRLKTAYRFNDGNPPDASSLTLCVLANVAENTKWAGAIRALRAYVQEHGLPLAIEIVDARIFLGIVTLPILAGNRFPVPAALAPDTTDNKNVSQQLMPLLHTALKKHKHGLIKLLDASGLLWTSLEFWWRGVGPTRALCWPTVLIGTPEPQRAEWWTQVVPEVKRKMQWKSRGEWAVEICFREGRKVQG